MKKLGKWSLCAGVTLLMLTGAAADELQLVNVLTPRGAFTPLYVRQPTGSFQAQQRGILLGQPIELYEETRYVVVHPTGAAPVYYHGRGETAYMAQR